MKFEDLGMEHREAISGCLRGLDEFISDFTFSILFVYRDMYGYKVVFDGRPLFIRGTNPIGQSFLTPLVDLRELGPDYIAAAMQDVDFMYPVAEAWTGIFDDRFEVVARSSEMDYIFRRESLASFRGGNYNRRRNRLKRFTAEHAASIEELSAGNAAQALDILDKWQKACGLPEWETDFRQCSEALRCLEKLPLTGAIYFASGQPAGFLIGERLNPRVYLIHFIKGSHGLHGLYEFMFNSFAKSVPGYEFINMEEDMGKDNLRLTKKSYNPEFLVKKCRVYLRK